MYLIRAVGFFPAAFFERGEKMTGIEFVNIGIVIIAVVFLFGMLAAYLIVRHDEKEHEKRMKEIKEKEQV